MYYKVVYFPSPDKSLLYSKLKTLLSSKGYKESPDSEYIFILGGDGSFLHFAKEYAFQGKKLIGIKAGNTAFLASLNIESLPSLDTLSWKPMELLKIDLEEKTYYAINDIYLSGDLFLEAKVYIDGKLLENFRGSGLLFSTRNGSTGNNKSIGGPIVLANQDLWIMQELGACNTNKSNSLNAPIILSSSNYIKIEVSSKKNCRVYIDGQDKNLSTIKSLKISLIKSTSKFVDIGLVAYIDKLRSTFILGDG